MVALHGKQKAKFDDRKWGVSGRIDGADGRAGVPPSRWPFYDFGAPSAADLAADLPHAACRPHSRFSSALAGSK